MAATLPAQRVLHLTDGQEAESVGKLGMRFSVLMQEALHCFGKNDLEGVAAMTSPALVASMRDEFAELGHNGTIPREWWYDLAAVDHVALGLWPEEAMAPWLHWGAADGEGTPPAVDSLGLGAGPLWQVATYNVSGSWGCTYCSSNHAEVHEMAAVIPRLPKAAHMARVACGTGGSYPRALLRGDWLFFRGPLPEERQEGRLGLPWKVLSWG